MGVITGSSSHKVGHFADNWLKRVFKYHGEIPEKEKTTGLNFMEAMTACFAGKKVRRSEWSNQYFYLEVRGFYIQNPGYEEYKFTKFDVLATDWEIL